MNYIDYPSEARAPMKPKCRAHLSRTMVRCFWGNYPPFLIPADLRKRNLQSFGGPLRAWERAKIPMPVARALGQSILAMDEFEDKESWKIP